MSGIDTFIQRRSDKEFVAATILEGMAPSDLLVVENEWRAERSSVMQELLAAGVARPNWPESLHWDWSRKAPELQLLASTGFGIVCQKRWQGVMMTKSAGYFTRLDPDIEMGSIRPSVPHCSGERCNKARRKGFTGE